MLIGLAHLAGAAPGTGPVDPFQEEIPSLDVRDLRSLGALRRAGDVPLAVVGLEQLLRRQPDYFQAHYELGLAYLEQGAPRRAVAALRRAVAIRDREGIEEPTVDVALGRAHLEQGEHREAERVLARALVEQERLPPAVLRRALSQLGLARLSQGNLEGAEVAFEGSVALGSRSGAEQLERLEALRTAGGPLGSRLAGQGEPPHRR